MWVVKKRRAKIRAWSMHCCCEKIQPATWSFLLQARILLGTVCSVSALCRWPCGLAGASTTLYQAVFSNALRSLSAGISNGSGQSSEPIWHSSWCLHADNYLFSRETYRKWLSIQLEGTYSGTVLFMHCLPPLYQPTSWGNFLNDNKQPFSIQPASFLCVFPGDKEEHTVSNHKVTGV